MNKARALFIILLLFCILCSFSTGAQNEKIPSFRVNVDTVYVKVIVSDRFNHHVKGLEKENFKIYEDNVEQTISHFGSESAPISLGIIFDVSNSMGESGDITFAKNCFNHLMKYGKPDSQDEYFLITFDHKVKITEDFTKNRGDIAYALAFPKTGGFTALYDAVYRGIDKIKEAKNEKKALILISDGEENKSRYSKKELMEFIKESDVQIYSFGGSILRGGEFLGEISKLTGGRYFTFLGGIDKIEYCFNLIHADLRSQYILGYVPSNSSRDGKWRKIQVKLDIPQSAQKLIIRAREGYYAPNR